MLIHKHMEKKTYCNRKNATSHLGREKIKTVILI